LLIVPLVATDTPPVAQRAFEFIEVHPVLPVVPEPPRLRPSKAQPAEDAPTVSVNAAPTVAPDRVGEETGLEEVTGVNGPAGPPQVGSVVGFGTAAVGVVEPPPPPPVVAPVRLHSGIRPPQKIVDATPEYPAPARAARIQGLVIVEATIDARGNVVEARILRSRPFLDDAALDAVRRWKYTPALLSGVPVPVIMTVALNFQLQP